MSTTAGVWSETLLQNVRVRLEAIALNDRVQQQFNPTLEAFKALDRVNTANVQVLKRGNKKATVEVEWINACSLTPEATTSCTFGTTELSSNVETYTLDQSYQVNFQVEEYDHYTNDFGFEEAIAKGLLKADKELSEKFLQTWIADINTTVGVNEFAGAPGTVAGTTTSIAAADWDASLYAYFVQTGMINKFTNPVLLNGNNLLRAFLNAQFNAGNADGKGAMAAFTTLPTFWDPINMTAVNGASEYSYLLSTGSWTWASAPKYAETMQVFDDYRRYSVQSRFIPGLWLNVMIKEVCSDNLTKYSFKVYADWMTAENPAGCSATNTGTIRFLCS